MCANPVCLSAPHDPPDAPQDSLDEVARQRPQDLLKPLRVHFIGEEGVDGGGLRKEFFELLVRELSRPEYGMFTVNPETRLQWLSEASMESEAEWLLVGVIIGLAIYNGCGAPTPPTPFHPPNPTHPT